MLPQGQSLTQLRKRLSLIGAVNTVVIERELNWMKRRTKNEPRLVVPSCHVDDDHKHPPSD